MGSKNKPGKFDPRLEKLGPDEPFFILRGQDMLSPMLVRDWIILARANGCPEEKLKEAQRCADAMERYHTRKMPD